jgi:protein CpxP
MKTRQSIRIMVIAAFGLISLFGLYSISQADEMADRAERHVALMKDRLELTDGQVNEIRAIMETSRLQAERDREKFREAGDRDAARAAAEARRQETDQKIKAVLNENQKKEYEKVKEEMRQRRENRGDRPGARRDGMKGGRRGPGR